MLLQYKFVPPLGWYVFRGGLALIVWIALENGSHVGENFSTIKRGKFLCLHRAHHPPPRPHNCLKGYLLLSTCGKSSMTPCYQFWKKWIMHGSFLQFWNMSLKMAKKSGNNCDVLNSMHFWYMTAYSGGCVISYERKDVFLNSSITFLSFQPWGTSVPSRQECLKHKEFGSDENITINNTILWSKAQYLPCCLLLTANMDKIKAPTMYFVLHFKVYLDKKKFRI
jgi:hypothetical protein